MFFKKYWIFILAVVYILLPTDLIPDIVPLFGSLDDSLLVVLGLIKRYLDYYQTHFKDRHIVSDGKRVDKVILCGQGANLKGLADFFSSNLKIPVEIGNPWVNVLPPSFKKIPELSFKESLGYTSALGLALGREKSCDL